MHIDGIVILVVVLSSLITLGLVAIFSAIFIRKLGNKKSYKKQEKEDIEEAQRLTPVLFKETQFDYTTDGVQPESKQDNSGYPHNMDVEQEAVPALVEENLPEEMDEIEEPETTPTLTVLLRYNIQRSYLLLKVINMFDLPKRRNKTEVNSFLEIRALPHFGQNPIQTDVYPNNSNPNLDETFEFEVGQDELSNQKIEFVIMDAQEYCNKTIGFVELSIDGLNIADLMAEREVNAALMVGKARMQRSLSESSLSQDSGEEMQYTTSMAEGLNITEDMEHDSTKRTKATVRLAKDWEYVAGMQTMILVSLHYVKEAQKMVLGIIKVANLNVLPNNKKPDPFVKIRVFIGKKLKLKKKTAVIKQELNPVYNQKLEFPLEEKDLANVKLVVGIKDNVPTRAASIRGKTLCLHEVVFGQSATGSVLDHWKAAIAGNKRPVAKWHVLQ